ncbi:protein DA1 [Thermosporothrix hazakensis]|uniref:Protein DA1 n=1 Tax=Thermosporothrix hazakensis TaxID=644383 RepID=A0A326U9W9_THEHA|nr:protein DA1 [Thermosporothrix hazakensis]PZW32891.1 protein DA1 [Thermosporothrix hazakensis]
MNGRLICKGCGQPVQARVLWALGAPWHPEHFLCAACGRPITEASFNEYQDAPYHTECYMQTVLPRCAYCGKPLVGEYVVDPRGRKLCREDAEQCTPCQFCGSLISPEEQERGTGLYRCSACRATAIETAEDAKPFYRQVVQWIGQEGLRYYNLPLSLELCSREKLASYMAHRVTAKGGREADSLGVTRSTTYTQNGQVIRRTIDGVAILEGLPAAVFQGVVAHELGHVWLAVHAIATPSPREEEGFCELLAYRLYHHQATAEARLQIVRMERNPDPIYGEGFRQVRALSERLGFQQLLTALLQARRWPGGHP